MMNNGMYNDLDETEDNDAEIEDFKHYNRGGPGHHPTGDDTLSDDSADQCMNKEEQENLF